MQPNWFPDPPNVASTIGKAAIVILVTFSIPLQIHPCRASLDAVLKWRPNTHRTQNAGRPASPPNHPLLPTAQTDSHGAPAAPLSDFRFALLTTVIIVLSYMTALTVSSLDRVLAYVGSTGSTSISFILPGLFYYKISDPNSVHHQRLTKEDDDANADAEEDPTDTAIEPSESGILESTPSIASGTSGTGGSALAAAAARPRSRWWRKKWRWDLENLEHGLLRRLSLCLAIYGICVMTVCLIMNTFFIATQE